ncbi:hypothetical protein BGZ70_002593 [Mortierella alpina]|uniref:Uncharacterized protein n=1 Tax=Mortierella alpina TaxID=64518 RepID=A0A9P6ITS5_MORAP|nr:hypothetical protein BGZ70_002593 [Mortierella alpina]
MLSSAKKQVPLPSSTVRSMTDYNNKATIQCKVAANLLGHGVNSVDFAVAVCQAVTERDAAATVACTFNDLPDNDFDQVLALMKQSAVADYRTVLHTLGKSMYSPLAEPGTLGIVYSSAALHWLSTPRWLTSQGPMLLVLETPARDDFEVYVMFRHTELRRGGKLVLTFPGVKDGESAINRLWPSVEARASPGSRNIATFQLIMAEICAGFNKDDWEVDVMDLQDIEELGASDYRSGLLARDDIVARTTEMIVSVTRSTFLDMWVEYGGLTRKQANTLFATLSKALYSA